MKKEEILEKSRQAHTDEGMEYAENRGRKMGFAIFALLFGFLAVFNFFYGESSTFYAISSLFWIFIATEAYEKYRFSKNKTYLISVIAGSVASICFVANYVLITLNYKL